MAGWISFQVCEWVMLVILRTKGSFWLFDFAVKIVSCKSGIRDIVVESQASLLS